jgi:hypothetical protein
MSTLRRLLIHKNSVLIHINITAPAAWSQQPDEAVPRIARLAVATVPPEPITRQGIKAEAETRNSNLRYNHAPLVRDSMHRRLSPPSMPE